MIIFPLLHFRDVIREIMTILFNFMWNTSLKYDVVYTLFSGSVQLLGAYINNTEFDDWRWRSNSR